MANYKKVAEQILSTVGGAENVASVTHCMTRLRFSLKDESLSNDEKLEDISSIISVVHAGGQVQLVIGPTVDKVYDEVCKQGGFEVTVSIDEELDGPQLSWKERLAPKHLFNQLLDAVSGAITPILPIFCVAGIFKMLVILFGPEGAGLCPKRATCIGSFPWWAMRRTITSRYLLPTVRLRSSKRALCWHCSSPL